ncbi:hypothetical protein IGI04_030344 [Brassica rapa subsp. trilocularis]|uniref:DUF4283 domain-containing protein n=1 Tax=Brassica rapa subsp. trilocularis TaxID=1813537 RepID=A0ABQ7LQG0_BRACM|nr:hypothetical protein IGI04_030344 [Brassica rapa subsp. trilocularis]
MTQYRCDNYQQADPTKIILKALQNLKLGADKEKWIEKDHRRCLVAKGLNPFHQNPAEMKVALSRIWQLVRKVESQINDDGMVNFYFEKEQHLLKVLDKQLYTYRGWIVALDRWSNRSHPTFLRQIPSRVRIFNLPDMYRCYGIVDSIGSKLGHVDEVTIIEPTSVKEAEVWVKILFDEDDVITLTRTLELLKHQPPVELEFRYLGLQKFCMLCGSLKHGYEACDVSPQLQQRQYELMDIGSNPYVIAQEKRAAIGEYITSMEVGQSSGTTATGHTSLDQSQDRNIQTEDLSIVGEQKQTVGTIALVQVVPPTPPEPIVKYRNRQRHSIISSENAGYFQNKPRMLCALGLHDIKTIGGRFTWIGKRSKYLIMSRMDRAVANSDWLEMYPTATVTLLPWIGSDHRPLLLSINATKWKKGHSFYHQKMSQVSNWKSKRNTNSRKVIEQLKVDIQKAHESPAIYYIYLQTLKAQLQLQYRMEEEYWRPKSRILWLQAGNKNMKYFHAKTKQRRSYNRILHIQDDEGKHYSTVKDIHSHILKTCTTSMGKL